MQNEKFKMQKSDRLNAKGILSIFDLRIH